MTVTKVSERFFSVALGVPAFTLFGYWIDGWKYSMGARKIFFNRWKSRSSGYSK